MKVVLGLIVLVVVVIAAMFGLGLFSAEDPQVTMDNLRNSVKPGMTWEQVAEIREPRKFTRVRFQAMGGRMQPERFDRAKIADAVSKNEFADGFAFEYRFSNAHAMEVVFDSQGTVEGIDNLPTFGDLLTPGGPRR